MTYSSSEEKPGAIGGGVVGETNLDTVLGQLVAIGRSNNTISLQPGIGNLAADILV